MEKNRYLQSSQRHFSYLKHLNLFICNILSIYRDIDANGNNMTTTVFIYFIRLFTLKAFYD